MDYSVFDSLIDSIVVIDENRQIHYCNEPAAALLESSVPRLLKNKKPIYEFLTLGDENLFPMSKGEWGRDAATPLTEVTYELKSGKKGKLQISIQPFQEGSIPRWILLIRETTLEEVLHAKYHAQLQAKEVVIEELKVAQQKLEAYSKNLEKMVDERTVEIKEKNRMLAAIMNSLGQGFLTFNSEGRCSSIYTKACGDILEVAPPGKRITEVLRLVGDEERTFNMWLQAAFSEALPFESLKELAPRLYKHSHGRHVTLDFFPIRNEDDKINDLVTVATDRTAEHEAQLALEKEKQHAKLIHNLIRNRSQFEKFHRGVFKTLSELKLVARSKEMDVNHVFRVLHTLEGESSLFGAEILRLASRRSQELIEPLRAGGGGRKEVPKNFIKSLEELELSFHEFNKENSEIFNALSVGGGARIELTDEEVQDIVSDAGAAHSKFLSLVSEKRKRSLQSLFQHFDEVTSLVAEKLGKKIKPISFMGGEIKVDPALYEDLIGSFVHCFRNAVDHGLEPPDERTMLGKTESGLVKVTFRQLGHFLHIEVEDDGRGINPSSIRTKLKKLDPLYDGRQESDAEVIQHIFDAGFSTKESVEQFSGRGVGMDALRQSAQVLGGYVRVESKVGLGTTVKVIVPLDPAQALKRSA